MKADIPAIIEPGRTPISPGPTSVQKASRI
jgi:hypothetical protein